MSVLPHAEEKQMYMYHSGLNVVYQRDNFQLHVYHTSFELISHILTDFVPNHQRMYPGFRDQHNYKTIHR